MIPPEIRPAKPLIYTAKGHLLRQALMGVDIAVSKSNLNILKPLAAKVA